MKAKKLANGVLVSVSPEEALVIAEQTNTATSWDRYAPAGWRNCCQQLALLGYDAYAIEQIMRSKWTRWAADAITRPYGTHDWFSLESFLNRHNVTPSNWESKMRIM